MDVFEAKFSQAQAFAAAGVQRNRGLMWFKAGHVRYVEADGDHATGAGLAHRLSARTVLRFALIDHLSAFMDIGKTAGAVAKFMDAGRGPTPEGLPVRSPGDLFNEGETVLCVSEDGSAEVVCLDSGASALSLPGLREGRRVAFFPLNELHATVLGRLERIASTPFIEAKVSKVPQSTPTKIDA